MNIATTVLYAFALTSDPQPPPHVALVAAPPASVRQSGWAKHYRPGLFEKVARKRGIRLCAGCDGFASQPSCKTLGQVIYAKINGITVRLIQADCSAPRDRQRHIRQRLLVELDFETAKRVGLVKTGKARVQVWVVQP